MIQIILWWLFHDSVHTRLAKTTMN